MSTVLDRIDQMLAGMDAQQTAELDKLLAVELSKPWLPTAGPQLEAFLSDADLLLYGGSAGGGKGQPLDARVLTPFGFRPMGSLKVGSQVCAFDGSVCAVIGVFPLGDRQLFKVSFHDGTSTEVTDDHIWLAWRRKGGKANGSLRHGEGSARLWTTAELMQKVKEGERFSTPITQPVSFTDVARYERRPVPPYLLGVLLGDGSITPKYLRISCGDPEIIQRLQGLGIDFLGPYQYQTKVAEYRIPEPNDIRPHLEKWGLIGKGSAEKFIPPSYLLGSVEQRWELLRGLLDTDGWCDQDGDTYYCTISPRLRDDVASLCRSLGALVTIREKDAKAQNGNGSRAYTLRIKLRDGSQAFALQRKVALAGRAPQSMGRVIVAIEPTRKTEAQCIKVSHPSGLYLTNDFIVTHNTDLICGLALTEHERSVVFRRQANDLDGFWERLLQICPSPKHKDSNKKKLTTSDGRLVECGHLDLPGSELSWQGRPHDLICFDEGAQLTAYKVKFVLGWLRSATAKKCRAVIASNPPIGGEGSWLMEWFAPWLDPLFPNPAKHGELRWAIALGDSEQIRTVWVDGPASVEIEGKTYEPLSRTFIPSRLDDNPYLKDTNYRAHLNSMPEPLRSQLLHGDFLAGRQDDEWQVIPSAWVRAAQERWNGPPRTEMKALCADIAQGGPDKTSIACLHEPAHFATIESRPGLETPDGPSVAAIVLKLRRDNAAIGLDTTGGWGGSARDHLKTHHQITAVPIVFSAAGIGKDKATQLEYHNLRAQMYWQFRTALDPDNGEEIVLPPGARILAQLTAAHWKPRSGKILIESKEEIKARLGVSPDEADAIVMAWYIRDRKVREAAKAKLPKPKVNLGQYGVSNTWMG